MNTPLATASLNESMEEIVEKFQNTQHYNIPVIGEGKYLGFVSRAAVLTKYRKLLKHFSED
jgi:CIC family chloride channel protein